MSARKINSVILGLLPVIMIYRVPFTGFGLSTLLVAYLALFSVLGLFENKGKMIIEWSLSIFFLYLILRNIGNGIIPVLYLLSFIVILGARHGTFKIKFTMLTIEYVALFISMIVIIQTLFHYVFGINIRTLTSSIVLDEYRGILGYSISRGIFRPSGLFLEPAHFAQYAIIALLLNMRKEKLSASRLIILSTAILCTTSGIGILLMIASYAYLLIIRTKEIEKRKRLQYFLILGLGMLIVGIIVSRVPVIQSAVNRVFGRDDTGYNAVAGRSVHWDATVKQLSGLNIFFGVGPRDYRVKGFITGLNEIIYYYGYAGLGIMAVSIIDSMIKRFKDRSWNAILCLVYFALLAASDVVGFIMISFWFSLFSALSVKEESLSKS